jgi:regulator of nonsense transcripts 2
MVGDVQFSNLPLISTFIKHFNRSYLGPQELAKGKADADTVAKETSPLADGMTELVPIESQRKLRQMFVAYFQTASKTLVKGQMVSCASPWLIIETTGTRQTES